MAVPLFGWQQGNGLRPLIDPIANYNGYSIVSKLNPKAGDSLRKKTQDYLGTSNGAFKGTQVLEKSAKLGAEIAHLAGNEGASVYLKGKARVLSGISGAFIFPYTGFAALDFYDSAATVVREGGSCGRFEDATKKGCTLTTAICYSTLLFNPAATSLGKLAQVTDLADDTIDLKQQAVKWVKTDQIQKFQPNGLSNAMRADLAQTKTQALMGMIKAVLSVVGGIFGILGLIYGVAVVPAIVSLSISTAACVMSIVNSFFKTGMNRHVDIQRVVAPVAAPLVPAARPAVAVAVAAAPAPVKAAAPAAEAKVVAVTAPAVAAAG